MCRLLLIDNILVLSHHITAFLCHNIPNHCDVTGSSVTSSFPLFIVGVVVTQLLTSLTTTKCSWQHMADPCIVGSAPQYHMLQYRSSTYQVIYSTYVIHIKYHTCSTDVT